MPIASPAGVGTINDDEVSTCVTNDPVNPAVDQGAFLFQNCSTGRWSMRVAQGGNPFVFFEGNFSGTAAFKLYFINGTESGGA